MSAANKGVLSTARTEEESEILTSKLVILKIHSIK